ncbi:hypothetical protein [Capnocytophaga canis]|uniref:hypothetical protein n=1 Tax=Capnocytophaga canis TaxID=1848903 RepID=UPI001562A96F|nr:hypothetical protein [Capnocytophaga canis]
MNMVTIEDIIKLEISKEDVILCIEKTKKHEFINNLRYRHKNVQFDCKLRGYIGELAIAKWFANNDITLSSTNYLEDGENIDIDFLVKGKNIELKTSLIPDADKNLATTISKRDIKLIKRGNDSIEQLRGDIHMQIYFSHKTKERDNWLKTQDINLHNDFEYLYNKFQADQYLNTTFFVAWIDKPSLITKINSIPISQRYWSFRYSQRFFWNCKLNVSRKPIELISYINNL